MSNFYNIRQIKEYFYRYNRNISLHAIINVKE